MKHSIFMWLIFAMLSTPLFAQKTPESLIERFNELTDTKPYDSKEKWAKMPSTVQVSWGSTDVRYPKKNIPALKPTLTWKTKAWKGERVNAQAVISTQKKITNATFECSDLKSGSEIIPSSSIDVSFVRYVMVDELNKDGKGACGHRPNRADWDSSMVADILDKVKLLDIEANTTQPLWVKVWVPQGTKAGKYKGVLTVSGDDIKAVNLRLEVEVSKRELPAPKDWTFHLDLWQNPYSVARYHNLPLWSKEHFDAMRPLMKFLADAGQKSVTTTIMHKPWNGQTFDHFDSMVGKYKSVDGKWSYDYTVFDKWVTFMMDEIGIDLQISCYTMIPWALNFDYIDQATNRLLYIQAKPGDALYADYWGSFLKDFSRHLREKGWFDKTIISMDERDPEAMQEAIKVIKKADPEFKISYAGSYHEELQADLYDLCIPYGQFFPEQVLKERQAKGQISTVYTCCPEPRPNTFTFSPPAEATWLSWHVMAGNYDGYLRWAYNSWTEKPLLDSRFITWAAGECYMMYPGSRSSIRIERLIEGIQDFEKVQILKKELSEKGNQKKLNELNEIISTFVDDNLNAENAATMVNKARALINEL